MDMTREDFRTILREELRLFTKDVMGSVLSDAVRQMEQSVRQHPHPSSSSNKADPVARSSTRQRFESAESPREEVDIGSGDDHELEGWRRKPRLPKRRQTFSETCDNENSIQLRKRGTVDHIENTSPLKRRQSMIMPLLDNSYLGSGRKRRFSDLTGGLSSEVRASRILSWGSERMVVSRFVQSLEFDYVIALAIILNAMALGSQTNYMAKHWTSSTPDYYNTIDVFFCLIFVMEMVARIYVERCSFVSGPDWTWNFFDLVVTSLQLTETILLTCLASNGDAKLHLNEFTDDTRLFQVLRIFRLLRILRVLRVLHLVGDLRAIITSIGVSLRPLCWTVILLLLLTFFFGVFVTQVVTDHKVVHPKLASVSLEEWYGTLWTSMLTLFEAVSGGKEWCDVLNPLANQISFWLVFPFIAYIAFVIFALINILTGIFVDRTIRHGKADHRQFLLEHVQAAITRTSCDGNVSWDDFQAHLQDPDIKLLFDEIDVDQDDAHELFHLLDTNQTGKVDVDEFISGCMRLDGPAKAVDLAVLAEMHRRQGRKWVEQMQFVNRNLNAIRNAFDPSLQTRAGSDIKI
eukprot:TRINITY_DN3291_c0_g1_i2.p1 TRINITY_DN3291_c0_g1~~TRINITY_DN3291_c0_g1_i2.p1  ORF type:complete len:576 (-),score=81.93 TRINITY_DN3291_c0_g1_i2:398-2125(-)